MMRTTFTLRSAFHAATAYLHDANTEAWHILYILLPHLTSPHSFYSSYASSISAYLWLLVVVLLHHTCICSHEVHCCQSLNLVSHSPLPVQRRL